MVKRKQSSEIVRILAFVAILISVGLSWRVAECHAQNRVARAEYDYYALAITSVLNSAREASKLPDVPQRVKLLLYAAKILAPSRRDDAKQLLDLALNDLNKWGSADKASRYQGQTAATLRNEVMAVYARIDPEKTIALQKEFRESAAKSSATDSSSKDWSTQFRDQDAIADQAGKIALSLVDTDPEKASRLVIQSLQGGIISDVIFELYEHLIQSGNRAFLDKLEIGIGQALAEKAILDPYSLAHAGNLVLADKDMPSAARNAFIRFFMHSVQVWSNLVTDSSGNQKVDASYINRVFVMTSLSVRPVIVQHAPDQLVTFDHALDQVAPLIPTETRLKLEAFQPETFSEPRDILNDILKDPSPAKRDLRLVGLISNLLGNESGDLEKNLDLASDAISAFSDTDVKSAYTDRLTITRLDAFVKQGKFIEAQQLAGSIASEETRAWALLALSTVAAKADRVLGFELISNALQALDKASPSPHKVELALMASAVLAKNDPQRAFDTFVTASRYANSSPAKVDPPKKPAVAFGLEVKIAEAQTRLGIFPESLDELKIDPSLSALATTDWFRSDSIVNEIREPSLKIQLKLQFADAVLVEQSKSRKKAPSKPSVTN
jgi:hypothetical protein